MLKTNSMGHAVDTNYFWMIASGNSAKENKPVGLWDVALSSRHIWDLPHAVSSFAERKRYLIAHERTVVRRQLRVPAVLIRLFCAEPLSLASVSAFQLFPKKPKSQVALSMNESIQYLFCFLSNYNETHREKVRLSGQTNLVFSCQCTQVN